MPATQTDPLIGAHLSIAGGLHKAILEADTLGCRTLQIFTRNARTWKESMPGPDAVTAFLRARKNSGVKSIFSHGSYLINIASNDTEKLEKSISALRAEMERSALLCLDGVILHPGAYLSSDLETGIRTAAASIRSVLRRIEDSGTRLLIETTAGQGTCLGGRFQEIEQILNLAGHPDRTGVCMDTSHIFAAGYPISGREAYASTMDEFHRTIGFDRLFAIHLNDSKTDCGSRADRHDHIGKGRVGLEAFRMIMNDDRLAHIPKILETPKYLNDTAMDPVNLDTLLRLVD